MGLPFGRCWARGRVLAAIRTCPWPRNPTRSHAPPAWLLPAPAIVPYMSSTRVCTRWELFPRFRDHPVRVLFFSVAFRVRHLPPLTRVVCDFVRPGILEQLRGAER